MWKRLQTCILFSVLTQFGVAWGGSFYLYEDFTGVSPTNGWLTNIAYGRAAGTVTPTTTAGGGVFTTWTNTSGVYQLRNTQNDGTGGRNGIWMGRYLFNTNKYYASSKNPFGVEVIRTYSWMDYEVANNTTADLRRHCATSLFLFEENASPIPKIITRDDGESNFWYTFKNNFEFCNETGVWGANDRRFHIGYYDTALNSLNSALSNAVRPDGRVTNIHAAINFDFQIDQNNGISNNEDTGWRLVHNGSYIRMFVNPNPNGTNVTNWPNEWFYIGERQVVWSSNIQFMMGSSQMANNANSGSGGAFRGDADFDDVRVRSAVDTAVGEWHPLPKKEQITIALNWADGNAGVNFIRLIAKTSGGGIEPENIAISILEGEEIRLLKVVRYFPDHYPRVSEAALITLGGGEYRLLLGKHLYPNKKRETIFRIEASGQKFEAAPQCFVTAERFAFMPKQLFGQDATTGWQEVDLATPKAIALGFTLGRKP